MQLPRASLLASLLVVAGAGVVPAAASAASGLVGGLAQPDEALVQRYEAHPEELAAKMAQCQGMGLQEAVANVACVSVREVRYRRERNVIRNLRPVAATAAPATKPAATTAALATDGGASSRNMALVMDRRAP